MPGADVYRRTIEAISRGDEDALDGLLAPDVVDHNPIDHQAPGLPGFKQWMRSARTTFPDLTGSIEDVLADEDRVAGRVTWSGTPSGAPAPVSFTAIHIVRLADGLIVDWWGATSPCPPPGQP